MVEVNQIYHMDCLELIDRMIKERIKVDCIIADPPKHRYVYFNCNKKRKKELLKKLKYPILPYPKPNNT